MQKHEHDKDEEIYQAWLRERRRIEVPGDFAHEVMQRIPADRLGSASPATWAKAALITLAAFVSVGRYLLVLFALFLG